MKLWKRLEIVEHPEGGFTVRDTGPGQLSGHLIKEEYLLPAVAFSTLDEVLEYLPTKLGPPRATPEEIQELRDRGLVPGQGPYGRKIRRVEFEDGSVLEAKEGA